MPILVALEERIETLDRRLSEWEGHVGFVVPPVRQLHREILAMRQGTQRSEKKVDSLDNKVDRLENKVDQGFALMSEKFREVNQEILGIKETLDVLPRAVAEEIARRR